MLAEYWYYYPSINDLLVDLNCIGVFKTMYPSIMTMKAKLVEDVKDSNSRPPTRNSPDNSISVQDSD